VKVPVLHIEGSHDAFLAGGTENFAQRLVIGPWDHVNWGRPESEPAPLLKDIGA
jgi:predicted acyl esterase